jgi:hypothetical protein
VSTFLTVDFEADADTLTDTAIASLQAAIPGWEPADGNLEVWLIAALARICAETTAVAAQVPAGIFREFGRQLIGIPPLEGVAATITTTWTARDALGHTAETGTQVAHRVSGDTLIIFETTTPVTVAPGATTVAGVVLTAVAVGVGSNNVPTGAMELLDALSWVDNITATAVSAGGVDAETDAAYLDRLTAELRLLTPRPILPEDFSTLARRVDGVYRCLTVDGYDPTTSTTGNQRMVCLFPVGSTGAAVPTATLNAVKSYLDGLREVSFVVHVSTPTTTPIAVTYTVKVASGYTPASVISACSQAVTDYLSPASWGGGSQSPPAWNDGENTVRYLAVSAVLASVPGVAYVSALTLNGGTSDVALAGVAALPSLASVAGTSL